MANFGRGVLIFFGIILLIGVVSAISWGWRYYTAEVRGVVSAEEQIQSGNYRIAAYERFYDRCNNIRSLEGKIDAQLAQLEMLRGNDASDRELNRVTQNITGLRGQRQSAIARYNADADKDYTAGQFRASDLPFHIDDSDYEGREKTEC